MSLESPIPEGDLAALLDAAPDAFFLVSRSGMIEHANAAACALVGCPRTELLGRGIADLIAEGDLEERPLDRRSVSAGGIVYNERPVLHRDGHVVWVETATRQGGEGRVEIWARDLTARRALEEEVRRAHQLESTGLLAAGLAHDLNNLITVITGSADLLLHEDAGEEVRELASSIAEAAERAGELTRKLQAFGRAQPMRPRAIDLSELARESVDLATSVSGEKVRVVSELAGGLRAVQVDPVPVSQALFNLVHNAAQALAPGPGTLTIRTRAVVLDAAERARLPRPSPSEHFVELSVEDDGPGMSDEVRARMFDPFFTTRASRSGLGLSVVHGVVSQSGGLVRAQSALGRGTRVELCFPAMLGAAAPSPASDPARVSSEREGDDAAPEVLVVDDERGLRRWLERLLQVNGYRVRCAEDGAEALASVRAQGPPDVVLSDLRMPVMNGAELAAALQREHPSVPFVLMTAYAEDEVLEGLPAGAPLLHKPFRSSAVLETLASALDRVARRP